MECSYDLLLKDGHVIDPAEGLNSQLDVAVKDRKIAHISKDIPVTEAKKVIPADRWLVVPGLIDMHCHPGAIDLGVMEPDEMGIYAGVTALCEGGECGAGNIYGKNTFEFEPAKSDVFCFLNLALAGFAAYPEPEIRNEYDINTEISKKVIEKYRHLVKGIKLRAIGALAQSVGLRAVELGKRLARDEGLPLVIHVGDSRARFDGDTIDDFTRKTVRLLDKGDVLCHYLTWEAGGFIFPGGTIYPELLEAQKRGVILDSCHGSGHLSFALAKVALDQNLLPDVISTDLSPASVRVVQSLIVTMSKFLNLGLSIEQIIKMTTSTPAAILGESSNRGSLRPGMPADISILEIVNGDFTFSDGKGKGILRGDRLIEPRLVIKNGLEIPCSSRYQLPPL